MQAMRSDSTERNSGVFLNVAFSISQANLAGATSDATGYVWSAAHVSTAVISYII